MRARWRTGCAFSTTARYARKAPQPICSNVRNILAHAISCAGYSPPPTRLRPEYPT
ncbi:hypothetical protein BSU04_04250 [Caballeronia sordidicola]|uniref:Uncharacterized protein n=1 Tax=Caballeronia sordidicola TaxID=196367 RepID=A0A226XAZ8_CABSO|nr:hypothetical protein BSU04_04250 [Caballeronia sordidicola]